MPRVHSEKLAAHINYALANFGSWARKLMTCLAWESKARHEASMYCFHRWLQDSRSNAPNDLSHQDKRLFKFFHSVLFQLPDAFGRYIVTLGQFVQGCFFVA